MPIYDVYLRPGLPGPNDVELYESAPSGQTPAVPVAVAASGVGVATVTKKITYSRSFSASAVGVASATHQLTASRLFIASATGVASVSYVVLPPLEGALHQVAVTAVGVGQPAASTILTAGRAFIGTGTGLASVSFVVIPHVADEGTVYLISIIETGNNSAPIVPSNYTSAESDDTHVGEAGDNDYDAVLPDEKRTAMADTQFRVSVLT